MAMFQLGFKFLDALVAAVKHIKQSVDGGLLLANPVLNLAVGFLYRLFFRSGNEIRLNVGYSQY